MHRQAIITAYTIGAISAQSMVIKDLSEVLQEPAIDMRRLFYGTMIQSGIGAFRLPEAHLDEVPRSLLDRIKPIDLSEQHTTSIALERAALREPNRSKHAKGALEPVDRLTSFLTELSVAAKHRRPLVTAFNPPDIEKAKPLLREDFYLLCRPLMQSLTALSAETPLARTEVPTKDVDSFSRILDADLFQTYSDVHAGLEVQQTDKAGVIEKIQSSASRLADSFPARLDLRKTSISILESIPTVLEELAGKVLGAAAKPFVGALTSVISTDRRIVIYSFEPIWRQVWESKLSTVRQRLEAEQGER